MARILVADDAPAVLDVLDDILTLEGHQVIRATSGQEALRRFEESPPELAVMFQMDGLGSQDQKLSTWQAILPHAPRGAWFGWKNFIDEDSPTRNPTQTVALKPSPLYISYQ